MQLDAVRRVVRQVEGFRVVSHELLARHETAARSRVITLDSTRRQLQGLTLSQTDLLREAMDCIEVGMFRAAHVFGWQAFVDLLTEKIASDGCVRLHQIRGNWPKFKSAEELRENKTEHELIVAARELGLIDKSEVRIFHGMLSERNECGHPNAYRPGLNESLGYVSKLISRMEKLQSRTL